MCRSDAALTPVGHYLDKSKRCLAIVNRVAIQRRADLDDRLVMTAHMDGNVVTYAPCPALVCLQATPSIDVASRSLPLSGATVAAVYSEGRTHGSTMGLLLVHSDPTTILRLGWAFGEA